jgi:sarcosine oxidase subunit beta
VHLLERRLLGSGGTGRSSAIIRMHYSHEVLVRLARRSLEIFERFGDVIGGDAGFVRSGWLLLAPREMAVALRGIVAMLRRLGVDTSVMTPDAARAMIPELNPEGIEAVAFEPGSGYADPHGVLMGYATRIRALGGAVRLMCAVLGIRVSGGRVVGVDTEEGPVDAPVVVIAAGPWSPELMASADPAAVLPITVTREMDLICRPHPPFRSPVPVISSATDRIYLRPDVGGTLLVGRGYPKEMEIVDPDRYPEKADFGFVEFVADRLAQRFPTLEHAEIMRGYAGVYDVTPDWHPVLDRVPGIEGLYCAAGFSGHGFKLGPAVGEVVAEMIVEGTAKSVDITPLRWTRFSEGALLKGAYGEGNRA